MCFGFNNHSNQYVMIVMDEYVLEVVNEEGDLGLLIHSSLKVGN